MLRGDPKEFLFHRDGEYGEARMLRARRYQTAAAAMVVGGEAELALCLSTLVELGVLDIEKLRAALVIAAPVAREKVAATKVEGT